MKPRSCFRQRVAVYRFAVSLSLVLGCSAAMAAGREDGIGDLWRSAAETPPALSSHEPVYFVLGRRDDTSARFQFSFRYRIFDDEGFAVDWLPPLSGLHFAYTQTSLWDLSDDSKPFRDTSYKPSFLWNWQGGPKVGDRYAWRLDTGLEHESNGRDEARSRSINIAYIKPEWRRYVSARRYAGVSAKLYQYLDREENEDITRFRGYADWQLFLGRDDGWLWRMTLRRGSAGHSSVQNEISYPIRRPFFADTGGYIFVQHFNGYGETLLDYNIKRDAEIRFGFAIAR